MERNHPEHAKKKAPPGAQVVENAQTQIPRLQPRVKGNSRPTPKISWRIPANDL
jgi:hypothetical protein